MSPSWCFLSGPFTGTGQTGSNTRPCPPSFWTAGGIYIFAVLFHWGILVVFLGHLIGFLFPGIILAWHSSAARLISAQIAIFTFGLAVLIGLAALFIRRISRPASAW